MHVFLHNGRLGMAAVNSDTTFSYCVNNPVYYSALPGLPHTFANWYFQSCPTFPSTWWRHQMEPFPALLVLCAGTSPVSVNSPHKGQWRGALMFSLFCAWINDWVNNRKAGDLRRHRGHCDVIVMYTLDDIQYVSHFSADYQHIMIISF